MNSGKQTEWPQIDKTGYFFVADSGHILVLCILTIIIYTGLHCLFEPGDHNFIFYHLQLPGEYILKILEVKYCICDSVT